MTEDEPVVSCYRFKSVEAARACLRTLNTEADVCAWPEGCLLTLYTIMWPGTPDPAGGYTGPGWLIVIRWVELPERFAAALAREVKGRQARSGDLPQAVLDDLILRSARTLAPMVENGPHKQQSLLSHPTSGPDMVARGVTLPEGTPTERMHDA